MTSEAHTSTFAWGAATRSVRDALANVYDGRRAAGWTYSERSGTKLSWDALVSWVEGELLGGTSPFEKHGGKVPVPWPTASQTVLDDQLSPGGFVAYTRRQVCYIAAKSLLGSPTLGYDNGLHRFLFKQVPWAGCTVRATPCSRGSLSHSLCNGIGPPCSCSCSAAYVPPAYAPAASIG